MINAAALAHTRTARGLSQRRLARLTGLNYQIIRRLELGGDDGNLTLRELAQICTTLQVEPAALLSQPVPNAPPTGIASTSLELDLSQARLLRRVQASAHATRSLTSLERQTVLPSLLKCGLVRTANGLMQLSTSAQTDLAEPDLLA